jgi:predicted nucleic acid-binding protein
VALIYADTSAVVRAYFADEPDHEQLYQLLTGPDPVVTSELTRVEFAGAVSAAYRARRTANPSVVLDRFDLDCGQDGLVTLLRLDAQTVLPLARKLVVEQVLRTLGAIHLAVALTDATSLAGGDSLVFLTRDNQQAAAAKELGLAVL